MSPKKGERDVPYKDLMLRWTGWKMRQGSITLIGQWVAMLDDKVMIAMGTNGHLCHGMNYSDLDRDYRGVDAVTIFTSVSERERRKQATLAMIIAYIDGWKERAKSKDQTLPEGSPANDG